MLQLAATITRCVYQNPLNSRQEKNRALRASTVRPKVTRKVWLQMDEAHLQPELRKSETRICSDFCTLSVFCLNDTQEKCAHANWCISAEEIMTGLRKERSHNREDRGNMRTAQDWSVDWDWVKIGRIKMKILTQHWSLVYGPRASAQSADISWGTPRTAVNPVISSTTNIVKRRRWRLHVTDTDCICLSLDRMKRGHTHACCTRARLQWLNTEHTANGSASRHNITFND